ncbi:MAG: DUF4912 domain-containing protein [Candidatus Krumholzibacteriota bacterium]|nr:DUF4912 domain-containing protein [Candidatus Krumholzibacteriota bacterium]
MNRDELKRMTKDELVALARRRGLGGTARMRKDALVEMLAGAKAAAKPKQAAATGKAAPATPAEKKAAAAKKKPGGAKAAPKKAAAKKTAATKAAARKAAPKRATVAKRKRAAKPAAREAEPGRRTIREKAVASKYYLGAEERAMPPVEATRVPETYGSTRIVAMVRDPHWLFAYWEIAPAALAEAETRFGDDRPRCRMILRVFDRGPGPTTHADVELAGGARNWYLNVDPGRHYRIAIGLLGPDGRFEEIAISGDIETPRAGVSDVVDDRWMVPDEEFRRIVAASGGFDAARPGASGEMREQIERRLLEQMGSGAVSSLGSGAMPGPARKRAFRLWVATELILYGATEPDARVTVQGEEIALRGDGTFSLRFALPDGAIDLPVVATSGDGVEERAIDTAVRKKSKEKAPVIR